jgi:Spy/CpxP family protein refolding chaperone
MKKETSNETLPRPVRRRLWQTLLLLGVFSAGLVLGGALTVGVIVHRVREAAVTPDKTAERIMGRMAHRLDLTDEQANQVRAVVHRNMGEFLVQRDETRRQVAERVQTIRLEISDVLTPEQEQKLNQRFDQLQKLWMPPSAE